MFFQNLKKIVRKIPYILRQYIKMLMQKAVLPVIYWYYSKKPIDDKLVLFADAHHYTTPYSMKWMHNRLEKTDYKIIDCYADYQKSYLNTWKAMIFFMKHYAVASYVFICDNFLPVASCRKRKGTKVIQLWHAGGILKKYAYDTEDDIPNYYKGNIFANYTYLSVSAECCIPIYNRAMRQPKGVVRASGLSRTDCFFDSAYLNKCKKQLYEAYPNICGKHIVLWAPTFRGKANAPEIVGLEAIEKLQNQLGKDWVVLIKAHPHVDAKKKISNCTIPTEQLLPAIDCLITDYSSVIFDYVLLEKPMVLFVPDFAEYEKKRGFYIPLHDIPGTLVSDEKMLCDTVKTEIKEFNVTQVRKFKNLYMGACDGCATERICLENGLKINENIS